MKKAIRDRLYLHQYGLCGYCEGSLGELGRHIEHVEPKSGIAGNAARTFDYDNLVASCQGDTHKPKSAGQDASCGHFKDQYITTAGSFVLADFISPREAGCEGKFRYLHDGRVVPKAMLGTSDYARADYTIKVAGLNCNRLRNRRRQIAQMHIQQINNLLDRPELLARLKDHYLGPRSDTNGATVLLSFYSTRRQRFIP